MGEGTFSAIKSEMSAGPPNVPLTAAIALEFDRSLAMTWLTPADDGHHTITAYKVYSDTFTPPTTLEATLGIVLFYQDIPITNRIARYYKITAVNSYGEGAPSSIITDTPENHGLLGFCLNHLLELVQIKPRTGSTGAGTPTYGNTYYAYGRVRHEKPRNKDPRGEEINPKDTVTFDGSVPVDADDALILPTGETVIVLRVNDIKVKDVVLQREALT